MQRYDKGERSRQEAAGLGRASGASIKFWPSAEGPRGDADQAAAASRPWRPAAGVPHRPGAGPQAAAAPGMPRQNSVDAPPGLAGLLCHVRVAVLVIGHAGFDGQNMSREHRFFTGGRHRGGRFRRVGAWRVLRVARGSRRWWRRTARPLCGGRLRPPPARLYLRHAQPRRRLEGRRTAVRPRQGSACLEDAYPARADTK